MPFVLDQRPFYKWKVDINVVVDGKESTESFIALFKNVTQSRFKEMIKMVEEKQLEDVDIAKEVLMGWEEMENEDGTDVEFNKANLNKALDVMGFATAVGFAFMESSKVRFEKN